MLRLSLKSKYRCEVGVEEQGAFCVRGQVGTGEAGPCAALVLRGFKKGWEMINFEF